MMFKMLGVIKYLIVIIIKRMLIGVRAFGLLRHFPRLTSPSLLTTPLLRTPFSEFFDRQDEK